MIPMPTPDDVNVFHLMSDRDSSRNAQHHTLGAGPYQAAAGNHKHDGKDSALLDFNDILNSWMNVDGGYPSTIYTPIPHLDGGGI
jgi:hypothetical protein